MIDLFTSLALFALALALGAWRPVKVPGRSMPGVLLASWHTLWCLVYWQYTMVASADASIYLAFGAVGETSFLPGTRFVQSVCVVLVRHLELAPHSVFLVFNLAGVLGLLLLRRAIFEVTENSSTPAVQLARLMVWLPGLSFWSAAPGKDGLAFLGAAMAVFSGLRLETRWASLLAAIACMFLVRPHMAAVLVVSGALAYLVARRQVTRRGRRLWLGLLLAAALVIPYGLEYAGLSGFDEVEDVTSYVEKRQATNLGGNSSVDISAMSPPERLLTFMFRPLFLDAVSVTGMVASSENLALLLYVSLAGLAAWRLRPWPAGFAFRFSLTYGACAWLLLANVTANLGIAVRQKTMIVPAVLVAGAMLLAGRSRARHRRGPPTGEAGAIGADAPGRLATSSLGF